MTIDGGPRFSHKLITAPKVEPVTVAQAKMNAHVDHNDEDHMFETWIKAGRRMAENYQRRAYIEQSYRMSWDQWPCFPLSLWRAPLISVESIKYYGTDNTEYTLDPANYQVDTDSEPGRIALAYGYSLPTTILRDMNAVAVEYTAGYGKKGEDLTEQEFIKDAIMLYCNYRYENRTAEDGSVPDAFYDILNPERLYI